jgi:hypothetical protein
MNHEIASGPGPLFGVVLVVATVTSLILIGRPKTYRLGVWLLGGVVVSAVAAALAITM